MIINSFTGEYRFLSNFWPAEITFCNATYPSVEHAYVASKTLNKEDRQKLLNLTAAQAKKLGRSFQLRKDWDQVKFAFMEEFVSQKFKNHELKSKLLATGDAKLIEGNTWNDTYWRICRGVGENNLGKILMNVRKNIIKEIEDYFDIPRN